MGGDCVWKWRGYRLFSVHNLKNFCHIKLKVSKSYRAFEKPIFFCRHCRKFCLYSPQLSLSLAFSIWNVCLMLNKIYESYFQHHYKANDSDDADDFKHFQLRMCADIESIYPPHILILSRLLSNDTVCIMIKYCYELQCKCFHNWHGHLLSENSKKFFHLLFVSFSDQITTSYKQLIRH